MFRVVRQPVRGEFRAHLNSGERPSHFNFDYALIPDPAVESITVAKAVDAPPDVDLWIADLRRGVVEACDEMHPGKGRPCSVRLEVTRVWWHEAATWPDAVWLRGHPFVGNLVGYTTPLPVTSQPTRTEAVTRLADAIRVRAAFDRLPILADALEEAGCDDELVLGHCRKCRDHAPRCWVVDWVLDGAQNQPADASRSP